MSRWPESAGQWMKYFETPQGASEKLLCRMEYIVDFHEGWKGIIFDEALINILSQLLVSLPFYLKKNSILKYPAAKALPHTKTHLPLRLLGKTFILPLWFLLTTRLAKTVV